MPAPTKCGDCKWCCLVVPRTHIPRYECHLHPPVLDGAHDPDKLCAWTFPVVNPNNERVCGDFAH